MGSQLRRLNSAVPLCIDCRRGLLPASHVDSAAKAGAIVIACEMSCFAVIRPPMGICLLKFAGPLYIAQVRAVAIIVYEVIFKLRIIFDGIFACRRFLLGLLPTTAGDAGSQRLAAHLLAPHYGFADRRVTFASWRR